MKATTVVHDDRILWSEALAEGLSAREGRPVAIASIECTDFGGSSSFLARRLQVRTADGRSLGVFFKDLNPLHQLAEARAVRDTGLERSNRERWMYRSVLAKCDLDTPQLYGERWREDEGRFWLFLEDVGPKRLSRLGDLDLWMDAAGWLARLHDEDWEWAEGGPALVSYAHDYFQERRAKLECNLGRLPAEAARIAASGLEAYDQAWRILSEAPTRLVHGEYFGKNVVIRPFGDARVAVIDWETVGVGPAWLDLVSISAGRWTDAERERMWRAYFDRAASSASGDPIRWDDFRAQVRAAAVVSAVAWLGWWSDGDDAHIRRWAEEVRRVVAWRTASRS